MQKSRHIAFAEAVTIVLVVAAFGATPASAEAGPISAHTPQAAVVSAASHPSREVFGFALASSLSDTTVGYPSWNFDLLTTVAYFGLHVNDAGTFFNDSYFTTWNSSALANMVAV